MSFKKGDRVTCVDSAPTDHPLMLGGTYDVTKAFYNVAGEEFVYVGGVSGCLLASRFTLAPAQPAGPTFSGRLTYAGLPLDAKERKNIPIYSGCIAYFPDALAAVAELSRIGNEQHNPGKPLHWDRSKSGDELDALMRHLMGSGTIDTDGVRHSTKVAWRALANLQKEIEAARLLDSVRT